MITVQEALELINQKATQLQGENTALQSAFGAVLAKEVYSPMDSPPFAQSAMDGYAVNFSDVNGTDGVALQGVIAAGDTRLHHLEKGKAYRIFTGALIPEGADTVIIQEHITVKNDLIYWDENLVKQGVNIRGQASQVAKGALAAGKGTRLTPGAIGFLASLGVTHVEVFRQPNIGILVTGDELVPPGKALNHGQIYESNGITLQAALAEGGIVPTSIVRARDNEKETTEAMRVLLETNDIVLVSGGISVGDFDFVHQALTNNQVQQGFYKVLQKPGKPLYFGTKGEKLIFGLPGNPASVLTCFYVYVLPAIRKMRGQTFTPNHVAELPLLQSFKKKEHLTQFMKAKVVNQTIEILTGQESYKMQAFTDADCLAILPAGRSEISVGETVSVIDLTKCWA
jgi:molybdopterin molybdotransferase